MCKYCEEQIALGDELDYGEQELTVSKIVPLPAINLTTGEVVSKAAPPFLALMLWDIDDDGNVCGESMRCPIKYCPMCGEMLNGGENDVADD